MQPDRIGAVQVDRQVAGERAVVREIALDVISLVAERDGELMVPVMRVCFMMCQRIGLPPISTIGLGRTDGFLRQPCALAACKNCDFHETSLQ